MPRLLHLNYLAKHNLKHQLDYLEPQPQIHLAKNRTHFQVLDKQGQDQVYLVNHNLLKLKIQRHHYSVKLQQQVQVDYLVQHPLLVVHKQHKLVLL